jgi:hypothetical protein
LASVEQPTSWFSTNPRHLLIRIASAFILLSSTGVCYCSHPRLAQVSCPRSRYFQRKSEQDVGDTTATICQTRWMPGGIELGFDDWLSWLSVVTVFLNASRGDGGALSSAARFLAPGGNLTVFKDTRRVLHLHGAPSRSLQRGHPVDILVQVLHGNAESTAEEAQFNTVLESSELSLSLCVRHRFFRRSLKDSSWVWRVKRMPKPPET